MNFHKKKTVINAETAESRKRKYLHGAIIAGSAVILILLLTTLPSVINYVSQPYPDAEEETTLSSDAGEDDSEGVGYTLIQDALKKGSDASNNASNALDSNNNDTTEESLAVSTEISQFEALVRCVEDKSPTDSFAPTFLTTYFMDTEEGEAIFLHFQYGVEDYNMLIDMGGKTDGNEIVQRLNVLNVASIDYLVCTNLEDDFIGGCEEILNAFYINTIYLPKTTYTSTQLQKLIQIANGRAVNIVSVGAGDYIVNHEASNVTSQFLTPNTNTAYATVQDSCAILNVNFKGISLLFCSDATDQTISSISYEEDASKTRPYLISSAGKIESQNKQWIKSIYCNSIVINSLEQEVEQNFTNTTNLHSTQKGSLAFCTDGKEVFFATGD